MTTDADRLAVRRGEDPGVVPVSPSAFKLYDLCPRWAGYERGARVGDVVLVDKLPKVRGVAAELGDRVHRLVEAMRLGEPLESASERLGVPLELWERWQELRAKAAGLMHEQNGDELVGVEETVRWRFPLPDGRECEIECRIDELWARDDGSFRVRDVKTGSPWGLPVGADLRRDVALQTYALAVTLAYPGAWRVDVELFLPESGEVRRVRPPYEYRDFERADEMIRAKAVEMATDVDFAPRPGPHCRWCPYAVGHCPLGEKLNGRLPAILDDGSAVQAAELLFYAEAVVEQLRKSVKAWADAVGPVRVKGGEYATRTTSSLTIPPEHLGDAIRVLRQYGVDEGAESFPVRWDGGKRLGGDDAIPELQEMAVRTWTPRFGFKRDAKPRAKRA